MTKTFDNIPEEKRQKIIAVAIEEFGTHGYEMASTNRIVKTLNVSKGSLFKYFPTKLELYMYLVRFTTERLTRYIDTHIELVADQNWRKQVLHYCEIEFDFLILEPKLYQFFYKVIAELHNPLLKALKADLIANSNLYLAKIYRNMPLDKTLHEHIGFIVKGYNEQFMAVFMHDFFDEASKADYLKGLSVHLDLIRG